jgi:parallel beta-helix repeat protein
MRRIVSSLIMAMLFLSLFAFTLTIQTVRAQSETIIINSNGSITPSNANITTSDNVTYTFTGSNYLPIIVNRSNIIINGMGHTLQASNGTGFSLTGVSNVTIKNTTITNSYYGIYLNSSSSNVLSGNNLTANSYYGIYLKSSSGNVLSGNSITANPNGITLDYSSGNVLSGLEKSSRQRGVWGISLTYSSGNVLSNNTVTANIHGGIQLDNSSGNVLSDNNIRINDIYGIILDSSSGNMIFHNDFLSNRQQAIVSNSTSTWDDGYPSGGNYWSDYRTAYPNATEVDSSGIWNSSYVIDSNNIDRYPLMAPFDTFSVGTWNGTAYSVDTASNSTITNLSFNATLRTLTFNVTGANGTTGFCRVTIPLSLMSGGWTVTVNGTQLSAQILNITIYGNYTYVYFTYHHSTQTVKITSTSAIPEFQPAMLFPLLMMITLMTALIFKRRVRAPPYANLSNIEVGAPLHRALSFQTK